MLNTTAVAGTSATLLGWLQGVSAVIASVFTVIWLGLQIARGVQDQIDRRRRRRLQAVQDTHQMLRADAITAAIIDKPIIPVIVTPPKV